MASHSSQSSISSRLSSKNTSKRARSRGRTTRPWMMTGALVACTAFGGLTARPAFARTVDKVEGTRIFPSSSGSIAGFRSGPFPRCRAYPMRQDVAPASAGRHAGSTLAVMAEGQDVGRRRYDIPAGPLDAALSAYQAASGVAVTFPAELVRGLTSPGVSGVYTADQALVQLLRGTSLTFRFTAPFAASLEIRIASEAVEVSGAAPRASSPKFTQPLRDTPQTITVIPQAVIEAQAATTPARRPSQRAGHHDPGRRRRHARGRSDDHSRIQRADRHLHRRRPRLRRLLARLVQLRAGRSDQGPCVGDHGPRLDGRVHQPREQGADSRRQPAGHDRGGHRGLQACVRGHQSADQRHRRRGGPSECARAGRRRPRAGRGGEHALGSRAFARVRARLADVGHVQLLPARPERHSRLRLAMGAGDEHPAQRLREPAAADRVQQLLRHAAAATTRRRRRIWERWSRPTKHGRG